MGLQTQDQTQKTQNKKINGRSTLPVLIIRSLTAVQIKTNSKLKPVLIRSHSVKSIHFEKMLLICCFVRGSKIYAVQMNWIP